MNYAATGERLREYRDKIAELRKEMRATQAAVEPEPVGDYVFKTASGDVPLSQLFADKRDLFDDFCTVYHFLELLPDGTDGFRPKFRYFET